MRRALAILVASVCIVAAPKMVQARVTIFAASSLSGVVDQSTEMLPADIDVATSYAGTQTLARQIIAGAPVDIFISANKAWMNYVISEGLVSEERTRTFARNRLIAVVPYGSVLAEKSLHAISERPRLRVAIGDPVTVPVGIYAKEALVRRDLWDGYSQRLLVGSSARSVLLWVERNEADVGFVYLSDAEQSKEVISIETFTPADHGPILYTIGLVGENESDEVREVFNHLLSAKTEDILSALGFLAP